MTRSHLIVILNVLGASLLFSLPHWASWLANKGDYTPFSVSPDVSESVYDESHYYATGPRRFMDTGSLHAEVDDFELRNLRSGVPTLHSIVIGGTGRLLGSLELVWVLCDAVFPALLWMLIYLWASVMTDSILLRMAAAWGTLTFPMGPKNSLLIGWASLIQPLEITRTSQPELTFPLLLLAAYLTYRALHNFSRPYAVAAGVSAGLQFYGYYYYWVALYAGLGALTLICGIQQKWTSVRRIILIVAVGMFIGLPFFFLAISKEGDNLLDRFTEPSHVDGAGLILLLVFLAALFLLLRRIDGGERDRARWVIVTLLTLLAGGAVGLNFQLVSGRDLFHRIHFSNRLIQPVAFLLICWVVMMWLQERKSTGSPWTRVTAITILVSTLWIGAYRQYQVSVRTREAHRLSSPAMQLLVWIRTHVPALQVVGTVDEEISLLLATMTSDWGFVPVQMRSMASDREIDFRYWLLAKILDVSPAEVHYVLSGQRYLSQGSESGVRPIYPVPPLERRPETLFEWERMDIRTALKEKRLDYIVAPINASYERIGQYLKVQPVYKNERWQLLKVIALS